MFTVIGHGDYFVFSAEAHHTQDRCKQFGVDDLHGLLRTLDYCGFEVVPAEVVGLFSAAQHTTALIGGDCNFLFYPCHLGRSAKWSHFSIAIHRVADADTIGQSNDPFEKFVGYIVVQVQP